MKTVILKETRPFLRKGECCTFHAGDKFEVLEEKELPIMGLGYKLKSIDYGIFLDGWQTAKDFNLV